MSTSLFAACATVFLFMNAVFILALQRKDNSIVDIAWGLGFILVAAGTALFDDRILARQILVIVLVFLWGSRLALHIALRNRKRGEDARYAQWRKKWGKLFLVRSYFQIFILQGILMLIISYPIVLVASSGKGGFQALDAIGLVVWTAGFFFESVADYQLLRFKRRSENKGRIITKGLWAYSRHPNYFGEALTWWGMFIIALSVERGWTAFVSPVTITFLLARVSGVPLLEKRYASDPEYADYSRRTSVFIPRPPKPKRDSGP